MLAVRLNARRSWLSTGTFRLALFAVFTGIAMGSVWADPLAGQVTLAYQETPLTVGGWSISITPQTTPFKKESPSSPGQLVRGVLNFGDGTSNAIPFLWQRDAGKLFLDLNRNQDLTDDPAGNLTASLKTSSSFQTFTNVHLGFNTDRGRIQVLADLNLWDYGNRPGGNLSLRCIWQGRVTLQGQDWQVGLVPTIWSGTNRIRIVSIENGHLLLRPWQNRDPAFNSYGSENIGPASQKLFFGGHAYQLILPPGSADGEFKAALGFLEQPVALGDLKITGKYVSRLLLPGSYRVILDHPADTVKIPVGSYHPPTVFLEQGGVEARCKVGGEPVTKTIAVVVDGKAPAVLDIGGPLTNSVAITPHGQDLLLDYSLVGAGGTLYQLMNQNQSKPPEFAVYRGGKPIASGRFEFG
jgi:hypothetical protein